MPEPKSENNRRQKHKGYLFGINKVGKIMAQDSLMSTFLLIVKSMWFERAGWFFRGFSKQTNTKEEVPGKRALKQSTGFVKNIKLSIK